MEALVFIIYIVVFLYSVVFHEVAHGWMANRFGDDTARISGRLSLNPLGHIDPIGSIIVPLLLYLSQSGFLFGWAKPVPVNPHRLKGGPVAYRWVTLAGVLTNLSLAVIGAIILKITTQYLSFTPNNLGVVFFMAVLQINLILAIFNTLPFPGFDGFNFITTFRPVALFIRRTPLANPLFMARYGLLMAILLIFLFMPFIGLIFRFIFNLFVSIFGL
jgi:Zn-dependent protease